MILFTKTPYRGVQWRHYLAWKWDEIWIFAFPLAMPYCKRLLKFRRRIRRHTGMRTRYIETPLTLVHYYDLVVIFFCLSQIGVIHRIDSGLTMTLRPSSRSVFVVVLVVMLSTDRTSSESRCSNSSMNGEKPTSLGMDVVNFTIESVANNRVVLLHDAPPTNFTMVVRRRADVIGPLCVFLELFSIDLSGDTSSPSSMIGVEGLPQSGVAEDPVDEIDGVAEFRFSVELRGFRLGRSVLTVTVQEQQLTGNTGQSRTTASQTGVFTGANTNNTVW